MPSLSEHKTDPEREAAYRPGYTHGVSEVISGVLHHLPENDRKVIEDWFKLRLSPWALDGSQSQFKAPDFPTLP
jgi:hypothetical protein